MPIKAIHTNTLILNLFSENFANNVGMQLAIFYAIDIYLIFFFINKNAL